MLRALKCPMSNGGCGQEKWYVCIDRENKRTTLIKLDYEKK